MLRKYVAFNIRCCLRLQCAHLVSHLIKPARLTSRAHHLKVKSRSFGNSWWRRTPKMSNC